MALEAPDESTGLQALIKENGGHENFAYFRDDEKLLADALSERKDLSWLKATWRVAGEPSPNLAANLATSEAAEFDMRRRIMTVISASRLLTNLPLELEGSVPGNTAVRLEEMARERGLSHTTAGFEPSEVRAVALEVLEELAGSADTKIRKAALKFHGHLSTRPTRGATGTQGIDVARAGDELHAGDGKLAGRPTSKPSCAPFTRTAPSSGGAYTATIADGRGGSYVLSVADVGDRISVGGIMRRKACLIAAASEAASRSGFAEAAQCPGRPKGWCGVSERYR